MLAGTSIITFVIAFVIPADPAVTIAGAKADPQTLTMIRTQLGLDQPLYIQYARYLDRALHGDLGRSYIMRENVTELIAERFPATAILAVSAMVVSLILGVVMGLAAAAYKDRAADHALLVVSLALISMPVFWLGTMLLIAGGLYLHSFPLGGFSDARSLILPTLTLALGSGGYYSRILHTSLGEVMGQDYIRTALSKGLSHRAVMMKHAMANALLPAGDAGGTGPGGTALRRRTDGNRFQLAGNRTACLRSDFQPRHPADHGHRAVLRVSDRDRESAGRFALRLARSAHPAG